MALLRLITSCAFLCTFASGHIPLIVAGSRAQSFPKLPSYSTAQSSKSKTSFNPSLTSKRTTTAFINKDKRRREIVSHVDVREGCIQQHHHSSSSTKQCNSHSNAIWNVRGGASSSSHGDNYNDGYGNDANNNDGGDYYNRYDGYDNGDGYGSSSPSSSSRDPYYDDDYSKGGRYGDDGGNGYYDDDGRYHEGFDDRGRGSSPRRKSNLSKPKLPSSLPTVLTSGNRKLGTLFLASGAAFTALGITLFFNKTLMRLGNLLFVCGIPLMIGPGRTVGYFLQPKKARATGCLACGIFLVMVGHPVIGIVLEIFGLLNLFGNMFPLVMMMAKNLPVVGGLFGGDSGNGGSGRKEKRRKESGYYDDRNYDDDGYYGEREYRR